VSCINLLPQQSGQLVQSALRAASPAMAQLTGGQGLADQSCRSPRAPDEASVHSAWSQHTINGYRAHRPRGGFVHWPCGQSSFHPPIGWTQGPS